MTPPLAAPAAEQAPGSGRGADLLKNSAVLIGAYVLTRFVGFLSIVWMARVLGPSGFGMVTLAQAILVYPTLLTHLGLMTLGTREVAQKTRDQQLIVRNFVFTRIGLCVFAYLLLAASAWVMPVSPGTKWLLLAFGLSLLPYSLTLDWVFKGLQRMTIVGVIELFRTVPFLLLLLAFVRRPGHEIRVAIMYSAAMTMAAVYSLIEYRRTEGTITGAIDTAYCRKSLRAAFPLGIAFIMVQIYFLTDTVLLGLLKNEAVVGVYAAAYKMVAFLQGVGGWYFEAVFPVLALLSKFSKTRLLLLSRSAIQVAVLAIMPIAVGGSILAQPMMVSFYGKEYAAAANPFRILLWAIAIEIVGMLFGYGLMAAERTRQYLISVAIGAGTSVALNLLLIPRYGTSGASIARLLSEIIIATAFCLYFQSVVRTRIADLFSEAAAASSLMGLAVYFIQAPWPARVAAGVLVYVATLWVISRVTHRPWYGPLKEIRAAGNNIQSEIAG